MCCICLRLRCVTQPDAAQAALLDRRDITLPKRMRLAEHEPWQPLPPPDPSSRSECRLFG